MAGMSSGRAFRAPTTNTASTASSELDDVVVVGEVAYTLARDSLSVTPRSGGEATTVSGHRLSIYRKQSDGRWLLARDIHTLVPGAE